MCPINRRDSSLKPYFTELNSLSAGVAKIYVLVSEARKKNKNQKSRAGTIKRLLKETPVFRDEKTTT